MPRPYIRRKSRGSREAELPEQIRAFLFDEEPLRDESFDAFLGWQLENWRADDQVWNGQSLEGIWADFGAEVVAERAAEQAGMRPSLWWKFTAPEPRQRLGGTGTPCCEVLAYAPRLAYGVPLDWIAAESVRLLKLNCAALEEDDPPLFESQSAFLERHGLFLPGERRRLAPDAFAPVPLAEVGER
jgi:hypothetical protein